jgi:hypothetical protein
VAEAGTDFSSEYRELRSQIAALIDLLAGEEAA